MTTRIAVIGDRFMLPSIFEQALLEVCGDKIRCALLELPWPDVPMEHGYGISGMDGLKEYMGSAEQVIGHVGNAQVLVTHLAPLSRQMFASLPNLRFVAVSRGGPVNIDMETAHDNGVTVVNTPGRNASAVAEFTIGAILAETRNITRGHEAMRRGDYRGDLYRSDVIGAELSELTVGVIGYGNVGRKVVRLLRAFEATVLVFDPYVHLETEDVQAGIRKTDFNTLLAKSDVVSLHPRVTHETRNMMNMETFLAMKKGAVLVNTARGPLMDYDALYEVLRNGHLRGAMLETFSIEPTPPDWALLQLPNVTLTPHIAGASVKTVRVAAAGVAEEVRRWLAGEPPLNPC